MNVDDKEKEITLNLLQSVAKDSKLTQRGLSKKLGLALGLTNSYLKQCVCDGFIRIERAAANRCVYHITASGLTKKAKLLTFHLGKSLKTFRQARAECVDFLRKISVPRKTVVNIIGGGDFGDIAFLVVKSFGIQVRMSDRLDMPFQKGDYWIVTDAEKYQEIYNQLIVSVGKENILVFKVLHGYHDGQAEEITYG